MTEPMDAGEPREGTAPHELWQQANGDRDRYLALMREHGHIVPNTRVCCGHDPHEPGECQDEATCDCGGTFGCACEEPA